MTRDNGIRAQGGVSRRAVHGSLMGMAAALAAVSGARAWPGVPAPAPGAQADADSLFLALGKLAPNTYAAGEARFARTSSMPVLDGLSFAAITMAPKSVRELHWHDNANELTHILSGSGVAIILDAGEAEGVRSVVPLEPGTLIFFPQGCAHAIWNTSDEPMELILGFDVASPETMELSTTLPPLPMQVLASTAGMAGESFPLLPTVADAFAVPLAGTPPEPTDNVDDYSTLMTELSPDTSPGGVRRMVTASDIGRLDGISTAVVSIEPGGMRLPHWHSNASEIFYCRSGQLQLGIIGPGGSEQTAVLGPGDLGFVPLNWLHYIVNVGDGNAEGINYHNATKRKTIELSDTLAAFPPDLVAASFGLGGDALAAMSSGDAPWVTDGEDAGS